MALLVDTHELRRLLRQVGVPAFLSELTERLYQRRIMKPSITLTDMPSPVPADVVTALQGVPTAVLADTDRVVMALGTPVAPMGKLSCFVGEALTIQAGSMAQWKALELAQAGHVLIIACQGRRDRAEFGAIYAQIAVRTGIAAIVTDEHHLPAS